ncbi:hypothetical protein [Microvirga mediterraneensis]|uniref:Uncharacterized protein n=1 Tax=Microvirga mediterraneensis TaxID=2754695 RepID=A0A838BLK9_9HYPH|nr:hypothetical protein [Microvirga mediterraneensis]MBA1155376.1 hypothetical protein [Microvirga mediterraneensis]
MGNAGYGNHTDDTAKDVASKRQAPQPESAKPSGGKVPAAGPHDKPDLTNPDATPGTGSLPEAGDHDATDSTSS